MKISTFLFVIFACITIVVVVDPLIPRFYAINPNKLQQIQREVLSRSHNRTIDCLNDLIRSLKRAYPNLLNSKSEWIFNNAGGAMGAVYILHASLTEYLILFGTPVGTEGHSGRFIVDDFFFVMEGQLWNFAPGQLEKNVYNPGDMCHLPFGEARQYRMPDKCWGLEYARGWIPLMLPFGLADTFSSTLDVISFVKIVIAYSTSVIGNLLIGKI